MIAQVRMPDGSWRVLEVSDSPSQTLRIPVFIPLPFVSSWTADEALEAPVGPIFRISQFRLVGCLWGQAIYLWDSEPGHLSAATSDQVDTLLDLARQGDEGTFRDLARCWGVEAERLDELWKGTVARAGKP